MAQPRYFDSHAHLVKPYFNQQQVEAALALAREAGVDRIVVPSTNLEDWQEVRQLAKTHPKLGLAFGIHPDSAQADYDKSIFKQIQKTPIIALGEIGIDLYREANPPLEVQRHVFELFCDYGLKHNLPLLVHMRSAEQAVYDVLSQKKYQKLRFVIHSYTGDLDWALKFIELGGLISFSGIVTFKNAENVQSVARQLPLDKIICETDTPYLTPTPYRGQTNQPAYVKHVAEFIARIRPEKDEKVIEALYENARRFFRKKAA
ncbi:MULTISPECIES: TatD family hydrolase [unclassified Mycoplasma]|uniref:TatD family hydrolase n=1 Tax=unclassified Mycoplasma TaxID=2683645 RepID=UPI000FDE78AD